MVSEELTRMRTGFVYSLRLNLGFSYTGVEYCSASYPRDWILWKDANPRTSGKKKEEDS